MAEEKPQKTPIAEREEATLKFWQENKIFEKSLEKPAPKGEFVFYEGPPTANGKPGIHHLEARAFKDAIPRYKTMQGYHVRRKGGWDTHGLPVELAVEKELGLKSKKEIETYGVAAFNAKCKESVWKYVKEWEEFTARIGYWIDLKRPFVTYKPYYIESVWNIVSKIDEQGLLYKDYKVVPWCPRCGTGLSSHELAQGYENVKDLAVTVKFKVKSKSEKVKIDENTYLLAWTTTPWTLPGNVALAVNPKLKYTLIELDHIRYIVGNDRLEAVMKGQEYSVLKTFSGRELVGLEYEPLYPFLKDALSQNPSHHKNDGLPLGKGELGNAFKVYAADFVTTTDGTGIVHTAVMYGQDDFELGTKVGLPKYHLVNEDGTFKPEAGFLASKFVKDEATAVEIIKDLAHRGRLFAKEKYEHSYPHCWRCHTPLIYYARDSWYIKMSALRDKLVAANDSINWEPSHIKEGRFGEWLREVKDWAISRERYWGTPLPVWQCGSCNKRKTVGSFNVLYEHGVGKKLTRFILLRHGESEKNVLNFFDSSKDGYPLTEEGQAKAKMAGERLNGIKISTVYTSPVHRARETADIVGRAVGLTPVLDEALWEVRNGDWEGKSDVEIANMPDRLAYNTLSHEDFYAVPRGQTGESWLQVEERMAAFAKKVLDKHQGETVVIVSHEGPLMTLMRYLKNLSLDEIANLWEESRTFHTALLGGYASPMFVYVDSETGKEIDPHRPFIDDFHLSCECGGKMIRVKEVMDVWFDSGAMPFAEEHYPFKNLELIDSGRGYPADFISEAIDQTRGWFYTLHAIGTLMGKGAAFKNVVCLGHILDASGKKMSKSLGNIVEPNIMIEKYGSDALRLWMYSVNQPGESKNFDEKTVDEIVKKVFTLTSNVVAFYLLYASPLKAISYKLKATNVLDKWILARLNQLIAEVTDSLDAYKLLEPVRAIRDFIADLSQWYLRRSRERIKGGGEDAAAALSTLRFVLLELAKLMAPFSPFFAEHLYKEVGGQKESVHLEIWPESGSVDTGVLAGMKLVQSFVSAALMQRAEHKIKVRQPLQSFSIKHSGKEPTKYWQELVEILKDEINVKEVILVSGLGPDDSAYKLDFNITPALKEEGDVRELVRAIQDFRKEMKLQPSETVTLAVETDGKGREFLEKYKTEVAKATLVSVFVFENVASERAIAVGELSFKLKIKV